MDASFDQFGGGGWGDQGEQEFTSSNIQKTNIYEKIPIPADIEDLLAMPHGEDKYILGGYSFNTIRVMGKVVSSHTDPTQATTYEICDAKAEDTRIAKRFTVIRYGGAEMQQIMDSAFAEGQFVQAVGKILSYNNRLSLTSFHIREVKIGEIEIYKVECKLARHYFGKNLLERTKGLENTIFRTGRNKLSQNKKEITAIRNTPSKTVNTQPRKGINPNQQQNTPQFLTSQQIKIVEFISRNGPMHNEGVHIEYIRNSLHPDNNFENDLQLLQNEGKIYSAMDDKHFAIV